MKIIRGKKALVTGAASGIGRAIALALAREGAHVYVLDVDEPRLAEVAAEAASLGVEAIGRRCDVLKPAEISASVSAILDHWGGVDILVNNVGVGYYGPTENMTAEQWNWLLTINLLAPIQFTRELLPTLLARPESHVLNVCSISGLVAGGRFAAYHVSKYGLVGLSEALRAEYGRRGMGVTALCPGTVRTNLYKSAISGRKGKPVPTPPTWISATPERVAAKAIQGIRRNCRLVLVTPLAYVLYYLKRLSPGLLDALHHVGRRKKQAARAQAAQQAPDDAPAGRERAA